MVQTNRLSTLLRTVATFVLLAMAGGRLIAATCEVACLIAPPASRAAQSQPKKAAAQACHEPASESAAPSAHIAPRTHDGCHDTATSAFVLTPTSIRNVLESGELARSRRQQPGPADVSAARARHPQSPPGPHRPPIVPLRI